MGLIETYSDEWHLLASLGFESPISHLKRGGTFIRMEGHLHPGQLGMEAYTQITQAVKEKACEQV